jgi:hypothetical protein
MLGMMERAPLDDGFGSQDGEPFGWGKAFCPQSAIIGSSPSTCRAAPADDPHRALCKTAPDDRLPCRENSRGPSPVSPRNHAASRSEDVNGMAIFLRPIDTTHVALASDNHSLALYQCFVKCFVICTNSLVRLGRSAMRCDLGLSSRVNCAVLARLVVSDQ